MKKQNTWLEESNKKTKNKTKTKRKKLEVYNKKNPYIHSGNFESCYDFCEKMYADIKNDNVKACIDYPPMVCTNCDKILVYEIGSEPGDNQLKDLTRYNASIITNYINEIYKSKNKKFIDVLEKEYTGKRFNVQKLGNYYKVY